MARLIIITLKVMVTCHWLGLNGWYIIHVKTELKVKHWSRDSSFVEGKPVITNDIKYILVEGVINIFPNVEISKKFWLINCVVLYNEIRTRTRHKMR